MQYTGLEVANHMLRYCTDKNKPINLYQLQRILYLAWIDYYKATSKYLFDDDIRAIAHSVTMPSVYWKFCQYTALTIPIYEDDNVVIVVSEDDKQILKESIDMYHHAPPYLLSELITLDGGAWAQTIAMQGQNATIPYETIIRLECQ